MQNTMVEGEGMGIKNAELWGKNQKTEVNYKHGEKAFKMHLSGL